MYRVYGMVGVFTVPAQITRNSKSHGTVKWDIVRYGQDITGEILNGFQRLQFFHDSVYLLCFEAQSVHRTNNEIYEGLYQYECT